MSQEELLFTKIILFITSASMILGIFTSKSRASVLGLISSVIIIFLLFCIKNKLWHVLIAGITLPVIITTTLLTVKPLNLNF